MQTDQNSQIILQERILQDNESPEDMVRRVARAVAAGAPNLEEKFFELIDNLYFLPNSPCLMNAGTEIGQLCACFVLPVEDSMESIFGAIRDMALIQKSGGGTGFSFSRLRPAGDKVNSTGGVASGPVSFLKVFNAATEEIKQGGRRRGASLAVLRVDHPDIIEFIRCKKDIEQITNFNLSVGVTNKFMQAVKQRNDFDLINPRTGRVVKTVPAVKIYNEIVENAWETGEPNILFLDTINADNPTPLLGMIEACNPCGEANLLPYESCVLGSINLSKMVVNGKVNYELLGDVTVAAVQFLDSVIDITKYPLPQIEEITKANRKIGLGDMGWADMLYRLRTPYDSDRAFALAREIKKFINKTARETSEILAEEKGPFPNFYNSIYKDEKPRRNAVVTSIAPTGTLASIAGTTFSIEPEYALVYTKTILDGKKFTVVNSVFEEELKERGLYNEFLIEKIRANKGSIQNMKELPGDMREVFRVAHDITPEAHIRMQAAFQEHTEQSISKTINLPENATYEDVSNAYMLAWEMECKGVTVYRDSARPQQVLSTKYIPQERPEILDGRTHKFKTGCGSLYVTVNRDLAGDVHEVFTAHSKNSGCVAALLNALARVTSIALRSGVAPEAIIKTMLGQDCGKCENIASCADAVGLALQKERQAEAEAEINQVETEACEIGGGCMTCS